jgi:hypothetical protein
MEDCEEAANVAFTPEVHPDQATLPTAKSVSIER